MKIGYLREDNEGNRYVIPEELIDDFECYCLQGLDYSDNYKLFDEFEEKFNKYVVEGDLFKLKIIMDN